MEVFNNSESNITSLLNDNTTVNNILFEISSNWLAVSSTKKLENVISSELVINSSKSMTLDDIVDEKKCLEIKSISDDDKNECTITIKMKSNHKIIQIGVVSEASMLEIFRDAGEYEMTTSAEFIDEFEGATVYYGKVKFNCPTNEASIKFKRVRNNRVTMFLYGIRIIVDEVAPKNLSDPFLDLSLLKDVVKMTVDRRKKANEDSKMSFDYIADYILGNATSHLCYNKFPDKNEEKSEIKACLKNKNTLENDTKLNVDTVRNIIDIQLQGMEHRLTNKIDLLAESTNKKLNDIIRLIETLKNN